MRVLRLFEQHRCHDGQSAAVLVGAVEVSETRRVLTLRCGDIDSSAVRHRVRCDLGYTLRGCPVSCDRTGNDGGRIVGDRAPQSASANRRPNVTPTRGTRPSSPFSSVALGHTDLEIDRYRGRRFICAHSFASNMARVSAMAPDNSACSCARYRRVLLNSPDDQHDLGADARHRAQIDGNRMRVLPEYRHALRRAVCAPGGREPTIQRSMPYPWIPNH